MLKFRSVLFVFSTLVCLVVPATTFAQTAANTSSAPAAPAYKSLLAQGYEIKDVMLLPSGLSSRLDNAVTAETVIVTLQKSSLSATCWFTLQAWEQQRLGNDTCALLQ